MEGPFCVLNRDLLEMLFEFVDCQASLRFVNRACRAAAPATARRVTPEQVVSSVSRCVWMRRELRCRFSETTLVHAAVRGGDVAMLQWCIDAFHAKFALDASLSVTAAAAGRLNVLQYLNRMGVPLECPLRLVRVAAANGQLRVLSHLRRMRHVVRRFPQHAWLAAAEAGRRDVFVWLAETEWPVALKEYEVDRVVQQLYIHAFALPLERAKGVIEYLHFHVREMGLRFFAVDVHAILDELRDHDLLWHLRWAAELLHSSNAPIQLREE